MCSEQFVSAGEPTLPSQICSAGFSGDYSPCQRTVADQRGADTETKLCGLIIVLEIIESIYDEYMM